MFSNSHSYINCLYICNDTSLITETSAVLTQKFNYFSCAVPISNLHKYEFSTGLRFLNQLFYLGNISFIKHYHIRDYLINLNICKSINDRTNFTLIIDPILKKIYSFYFNLTNYLLINFRISQKLLLINPI